MFKKILIGLLMIGVVGVLAYGAMNRTIVKAYNESADLERGKNGQDASEWIAEQGRGRNQKSDQEIAFIEKTAFSETQERGGNVRNGTDSVEEDHGRYGQSEQDNTQSSEAVLAEDKEWLYLDGTVSQVTDEEIVIVTSDAEQILLEGRSLRFAQSIGFTADVGGRLQLKGFYEGDEVEIGEITTLATGQVFTLRSEEGRPLWAGKGGWRGGKV